jgi:hypothetical protein
VRAMTDREFAREVGPWGLGVMTAAMLGIFFSRWAMGLDALQSAGYSLSALFLIPMVWVFAGRYASYWLARVSKRRVQILFVVFWALLTAKLFFLPWPEAISPTSIVLATMGAVVAGFAASRGFHRVSAGDVEPIRETNLMPILLHPILIVVFATLLIV